MKSIGIESRTRQINQLLYVFKIKRTMTGFVNVIVLLLGNLKIYSNILSNFYRMRNLLVEYKDFWL